MLSYFRVDRSVADLQAKRCIHTRKELAVCKQKLKTQTLMELSRPGTIGAAFVVGTLAGGNSEDSELQKVEAQQREILEALTGMTAALTDDDARSCVHVENGSVASQGTVDGSTNGDRVKDIVTTTVVRFLTTIAIKKASELDIFGEA